MVLDKTKLAVIETQSDPARLNRARALAARLELELRSAVTPGLDGFFRYHGERLELHLQGSRQQAGQRLSVDFLCGKTRYRYRYQRTIRQPLARATGLKPGYRPCVLDGTAGFGTDAFILASLGCSITLAERSPLVWVLIEDGLIRGGRDPELGHLFRENMRLLSTDSRHLLKSRQERFDTVYLDPMYPKRAGSALSKLDIRLLRKIVGSDDDWPELLQEALDQTKERVVLKRPRQEPPTRTPPPSFSISGKKHRWDVYLKAHL